MEIIMKIMKIVMKIVKRIKKKKFLSQLFLIAIFLGLGYQMVYENEKLRKNAKKYNKFRNDAMEKAKKRSKEFKLDYNSSYAKDIEILIDTPKY